MKGAREMNGIVQAILGGPYIGSEKFARDLADAIERIADTTAGSIGRKYAKQDLIKLIIEMNHKEK